MKIKVIRLPEKLRPLTKELMSQVIEELEKKGRLDALDTINLYILAGNIEKYLACEEKTAGLDDLTWETPAGSKNLLPEVNLQRQLQTYILAQLKEMGLTLASRNRMTRLEPEKEEPSLADRLSEL